MRRLVVFLLIALLALPLSLSAQENLPDSLCLITDAGENIDDGGFNESSYAGMQRAAEAFGLETTYIQTESPTDYAANIDICLDDGYDIIITIGFALADATRTAATNNPDKFFIGVDQDFLSMEPVANLIGLQFREDQGGFLAGALAALMTETGIVGGVYGVDIFPVVKFRNGFEQGARYINPDITVLGTYADSFTDPTFGRETALTLIGEGADVIFGAGGETGSGGIAAAAEEGNYVIGVDLDEYFTTFGGGESPGAENILSSAIKRTDNGVFDIISQIMSGEPLPDNSTYVVEIANGGIELSPTHDADVPQEVLDRTQEIYEGLLNGTIVTGVHPVTGELLETIPATAAAGDFTILLQAVEAAGLAETLTTGGPFTVFAPTDEAFAAALEALGLTAEELLADTETLTSILLYHVADRALVARDVVAADAVPTLLEGASVDVTVEGDSVMLNEANVVAVDIHTSNGIIHVIDAVLLPPTE